MFHCCEFARHRLHYPIRMQSVRYTFGDGFIQYSAINWFNGSILRRLRCQMMRLFCLSLRLMRVAGDWWNKQPTTGSIRHCWINNGRNYIVTISIAAINWWSIGQCFQFCRGNAVKRWSNRNYWSGLNRPSSGLSNGLEDEIIYSSRCQLNYHSEVFVQNRKTETRCWGEPWAWKALEAENRKDFDS